MKKRKIPQSTIRRNKSAKSLDRYERKWQFVLLPNEVLKDVGKDRDGLPEGVIIPRRSQKFA